MRDDVLPYPAMAFSLLAGLSSVLVGFLAPHVPLLNPIISLTGPSSSGKSTAGVVAASTAFRPVLGVNCGIDNLTGEQKQLIGGISSWAATRNALIARLQANQGFPVVLDELSKTELGDLSSIVYILSEGTVQRLHSEVSSQLSYIHNQYRRRTFDRPLSEEAKWLGSENI